MTAGDVLYVESTLGVLAGLSHVGAAGGFAGHVMLVAAPPQLLTRGSQEANRIEVVWPVCCDVQEVWKVKIFESLRGEAGLHESEVLLFVDTRDGQLKLFGDIGAEGPDGLELGQMDNEVVELWRSPPLLREFLRPRLVAEVLTDMKKGVANWSITTALRAVFMAADSFKSSDRTSLLAEILGCWEADPICTSVVIIFWQRYLCKLASAPNCSPQAYSQGACLDLILKWMPIKADRGLPGELLQTMQKCGWMRAQNFDASLAIGSMTLGHSVFVGPSSECARPAMPVRTETSEPFSPDRPSLVGSSPSQVNDDMDSPFARSPRRTSLPRLGQLQPIQGDSCDGVHDCNPCLHKSPDDMVDSEEMVRNFGNMLQSYVEPSSKKKNVSAIAA